MAFPGWLTTRRVRGVFEKEIQGVGGSVRDAFDDGRRLFLRGVLPAQRAVRPGDALQGGVALRATMDELEVIPYVFRQVCQNGAIRAHALEAHRLDESDFNEYELDGLDAARALREAIQVCLRPEVFTQGVQEMRAARGRTGLEHAVELAAFVHSHFPARQADGLIEMVLEEAERQRDASAFGLMNAVTAVARETTDPEVRWRLEVVGAHVPLALPTRPRAGRSVMTEPVIVAEAVVEELEYELVRY